MARIVAPVLITFDTTCPPAGGRLSHSTRKFILVLVISRQLVSNHAPIALLAYASQPVIMFHKIRSTATISLLSFARLK